MGNKRCGTHAELKKPRNPGEIDRPPHILRKTSASEEKLAELVRGVVV
jgi:hypothetical protein